MPPPTQPVQSVSSASLMQKEAVGKGKSTPTEPASAPVASIVHSESFEIEAHYYPRVLNAQRHPLITSFMGLSNKTIALRYCHLHPEADYSSLLRLLSEPTKHFMWAGADLFAVTDNSGKKQMIVVETNSCPSGNKSLPLPSDELVDHDSNYHKLVVRSFWPRVSNISESEGALAVVYDKNHMEASGYAAAMADISGEKVYLAVWKDDEKDPPCKITGGKLFVRVSDMEIKSPSIKATTVSDDLDTKTAGAKITPTLERDPSSQIALSTRWIPVRAAYRYVTQKPWTRIPVTTPGTFIYNPVICCLAGGRNKMCADKAYEFFNHKHFGAGINIKTPVTIRDVHKREVPIWVKSMGGFAVVKVPYSNAGQGVYTICSKKELEAFMAEEHQYDKFIVQSLVGNHSWSSDFKGKKYYHTGTIPSKKGATYVADVRMMVYSSDKGFRVCSMYARRAASPLTHDPPSGTDSWSQLGTNLSVKLARNKWDTDTSRLLLVDSRDFNKLGLGIDDLIDGYIQTIAAVTAIDDMADELVLKGKFDRELYESVNSDATLLEEII